MSHRARRTTCAAVVLVVTSALGLTGCSGSEEKPAEPAPVAIAADHVPDNLAIGVIVSLTSRPGQGAEWSSAAEGAQVAAYRFGLAHRTVTLRAEDDKGTATGAAAAARKLIGDGVAGIVLASSGSHIRGALDVAAQADVPVLLPYDDGSSTGLRDIAWTTGPDHREIGSALADALSARHLSHPLLVDAGGGRPAGVDPTDTRSFRPGARADRLARKIASTARKGGRIDSIVVSGPASAQATVVAALQGAGLRLPVLLTPDALSPDFAESLAKAGGTLSGDLTTVGPDAGPPAAMQPGPAGAAMSAYFAALRAAAGDDRVKDFFDDRPFATVADDADSRSHDAVVALVAAATQAGSAKPAEVKAALARLHLDDSQGLAGPALDLTSPTALPADEVTVLQATAQDLGLRPSSAATPGPQLQWFRAPSTGGS